MDRGRGIPRSRPRRLPTPKAQKPPANLHCKSEVIRQLSCRVARLPLGTIARLGSDGAGVSRSYNEFVGNKIFVHSKAAAGLGLFWLDGEVDSLAAYGNVVWSDAGPCKLIRQNGPALVWTDGKENWLPAGTKAVPPAWQGHTTP